MPDPRDPYDGEWDDEIQSVSHLNKGDVNTDFLVAYFWHNSH